MSAEAKNGWIERALLWACFMLLLAITSVVLNSYASDVQDLRLELRRTNDIARDADRRSATNTKDIQAILSELREIKSGVNDTNTKLESFLAADSARREAIRE